MLAQRRLASTNQQPDTSIRESLAFQIAHLRSVEVAKRHRLQTLLGTNEIFNLGQEPWIDFAQIEHFLLRIALPERLSNVPDPLRAGTCQFAINFFAFGDDVVKSVGADFQPAQGFRRGARQAYESASLSPARSVITIW